MERTQYRIDHSPLRKCYRTDDGYLYAEATFARDGILEYTRADGSKRRELRLPEENKKALTGFGRKPFTVEHPTVLVNADNYKDLTVGMTDPEVVYDKSGFVRGVITVMDSTAVDKIISGEKSEVSVGYQCRLENSPGVWNGQHYDAIQRDIVVNHVCCTSRGRAGKDVRIHLDSEAAENIEIAYSTDSLDAQPHKGGTVASLTIGNATYENLPAEVVAAMSGELQRIDSIKQEVEKLRSDNEKLRAEYEESNERVDSLAEELAQAVERADTQEGRADRFEEILDDSISLLGEEGYKWDSDNFKFIREDSMDKDEDDIGGDSDPEEMDQEEMPMEYKKSKKKGMKKDMMKKGDADEEEYEDEDFEDEEEMSHQDSVEDIVAAALEAEEICPGIRQDSAFSTTSVREIQEAVIARLDSEYDLSQASDGYVAGVYYALTQSARQDSAQTAQSSYSYAQQAFDATTMASAGNRNDALADIAGESAVRMAEAWKKPLGK